MKKDLTNKIGFTLIELIVIISIIAFLSTLILVSIKTAREKARISKAMQFSQSINNTLGSEAVASWAFEEESGTTVVDGSGLNHNAIIEGAVRNNSGIFGNSVTLNSGNRVIIYSGMNLGDSATICGWGNATSFSSSMMLFSCNSPTVSGPDLYFISNSIFWNTGDGGGNPFRINGINVPQPSVNEWHHYCVVNDKKNNKAYLYLDGTAYGEATYRNTFQEGRAFIVGNYYPGSTGYAWRGKIDEFRVYNQALNLVQIKKLYAEGVKEFKIAEKSDKHFK